MWLINKDVALQLLWMLHVGTTPVSTQAINPSYNNPNVVAPVALNNAFWVQFPSYSSVSRQGLVPNEKVRRRRNVLYSTMSKNYSSIIEQRVLTSDAKGRLISDLVKFLVESASGRNVYIFYEEVLYPDISEAVESCSKMTADVTLLKCDSAIKGLERFIKAFNLLESLRNVIVMCTSSMSLEIFQQINEQYLESASIHWFVVLQENIITQILAIIREGTQVSFAKKTDEFNYQLSASFIDISSEVSLRPVGTWSWDPDTGPSSKIKGPLVKSLDDIYNDFGGRELIATVIDNWPYWGLKYLDDGTIIPESGLDFHILTTMSKKLNFTFRIKMTPDKTWGGVLEDGTVIGMVAAVHTHSVNFAINEITITANREIATDFTYPYFFETKTVISPAPKKRLSEYAVFMSFTYKVWILIAVFTLIMGPLVQMIVWIRKKYFGEVHKKWDSLSITTLTMFKSAVSQAAEFPPSSSVYKLIFASWYLFSLLIASMYSSVMISALAVPDFEKPIDSLFDLLDAMTQHDIDLAVKCESNNEYVFSMTDQQVYSDIYKAFNRETGCITNSDEGMNRVLTGKYAFVNNKMSGIVRAILRGREKFHFAKYDFYEHGYSICCPRGSPYRLFLQKILMPITWSGLVQKYTNDELMKAPKPDAELKSGPDPINLVHLQAGFFLYLAGNLLALLALFAEQFYHSYKRANY